MCKFNIQHCANYNKCKMTNFLYKHHIYQIKWCKFKKYVDKALINH